MHAGMVFPFPFIPGKGIHPLEVGKHVCMDSRHTIPWHLLYARSVRIPIVRQLDHERVQVHQVGRAAYGQLNALVLRQRQGVLQR